MVVELDLDHLLVDTKVSVGMEIGHVVIRARRSMLLLAAAAIVVVIRNPNKGTGIRTGST